MAQHVVISDRCTLILDPDRPALPALVSIWNLKGEYESVMESGAINDDITLRPEELAALEAQCMNVSRASGRAEPAPAVQKPAETRPERVPMTPGAKRRPTF